MQINSSFDKKSLTSGYSDITADNVYLNIDITNNTFTDLPVEYTETRTQSLVDDPSKYYLTVARFKCPRSNIPLFNMLQTDVEGKIVLSGSGNFITLNGNFSNQITQGGTVYPLAGKIAADTIVDSIGLIGGNTVIGIIPALLAPLSVTDSIKISSSPYQVIIQGGFNQVPVSVLYPPNLTPTVINGVTYHFINNIQDFVDATNTALAIACSNGTTPGTHIPFIQFDSPTSLFSLITDTGVYFPQNPTGAKIYFTLLLYQFYETFLVYTRLSLSTQQNPWAQISILNTGNNTITVTSDPQGAGPYTAIQTIQKFQALYNWDHLEKILIVTKTMPIQSEFLNSITSDEGLTIPLSEILSLPGANNFTNIVTDFEVLSEGTIDRSPVLLVPEPQYRLIDFRSKTPLTQFDFKVFWQARNYPAIPLTMKAFDVFNIKFAFINKDLWKKR